MTQLTAIVWLVELERALMLGEELLERSCVFCGAFEIHQCRGGYVRAREEAPYAFGHGIPRLGVHPGLVDPDHFNLRNYERL